MSPIAFQETQARENPPCSPVSMSADPAPRPHDPPESFSIETYPAAAETTTGDTTSNIGSSRIDSASTGTIQRHRDRTSAPSEKKGDDKVGPGLRLSSSTSTPFLSSGKVAAAEDRTSAPKEDNERFTDEEERGAGGDPLSSSVKTVVTSWGSPPGDDVAPMTPRHGSYEKRLSSHSIEENAAMICESTTTSTQVTCWSGRDTAAQNTWSRNHPRKRYRGAHGNRFVWW